MCSKKDAYTGWLTLRELCVETDFLIDKRNRKIVLTGSDYSYRFHRLELHMIQQAIFCFLISRYIVMVGNRWYELGGVPMGLVLSGITLSLNMVSIEYLKRHRLHNEMEFQQLFPISMDSVTALRYVDDLLVVSSALCGDCLKEYITAL